MNIFKDPITEQAKISKKGRMTLELNETGEFVTKTEGTGDPYKVGTLTEAVCSITLTWV